MSAGERAGLHLDQDPRYDHFLERPLPVFGLLDSLRSAPLRGDPMTLAFVQILLTAAACFGLWRLWTALSGRGRASLIIAAGLLVRALLGQILFWISWLRLPVARSLQSGGGFWFFAIDGPGYLEYSLKLIDRGLKAILFITAAYPSRVYLQFFTAFVAAFGVVESVAILFNCTAYLLTCAIILRLGWRDARTEMPRIVALAAVSLGPGTILWTLQPLKDTFFLLLITAMIWACFRWQELWREGGSPRWPRLLACAAAMIALTYAIGGVRWYFAAIVWAGCFVFFILAAIPARPRIWALLASALLFVILAQAVRLGGDADIPPRLRNILDPRPSIVAQWQPSYVPHLLVEQRHGFQSTAGATAIAAGPALARVAPVEQPLVSGFAATFVPRTLAGALGLVRIGGGRGFWLFVELDTLIFDALIVFAMIYCIRALRTYARATPLFVLVLLVFLMTAGPMIYTVTNFGTLFRLRQMLYLVAALVPLTLAKRTV